MPETYALGEMTSLVGRTFTGGWKTIGQERIDAFADVTEDHQFIHVDPERAKDTPFGGTVAHGFLTLSMLSALVPDDYPMPQDVAMGVNYGFERVRFMTPVPSGARIRAVMTLLAFGERRPKQHQSRWDVTVEIEGSDKPALKAEWLTLVFLR